MPVLQVVLSTAGVAHWRESARGLATRDMAMSVALPEIDGRIPMQIAINICGVALMIGTAQLIAWYKSMERVRTPKGAGS